MELSEEEKHIIYYQLSYGARRYVEKQFGEDASTEFFDMFSANFTQDEWKTMMRINDTIHAVYKRRLFEVDRYYVSKENLDELYEKNGIPPAVDSSYVSPKTLQVGLLIAWNENTYTKKDDESKLAFERRKDFHDYFFGHVNHEALTNQLLDFDSVIDEKNKQKEKLQNYIYIVNQKYKSKNDATPGTG